MGLGDGGGMGLWDVWDAWDVWLWDNGTRGRQYPPFCDGAYLRRIASEPLAPLFLDPLYLEAAGKSSIQPVFDIGKNCYIVMIKRLISKATGY
jgi:hypothetical protein